MILLEHDGRLVQHRDREVLYYAVRLHVAEERDLSEDRFLKLLVAPQNDYIRRDSHSAKLLHGMLGRL